MSYTGLFNEYTNNNLDTAMRARQNEVGFDIIDDCSAKDVNKRIIT